MKDQAIELSLRRLTDEELRDLATSELTDEGIEALGRELKRRESPQVVAERDQKAKEWQRHEEEVECKREINRRARGYAWVVVLVVLPIVILLGWGGSRSTESELTPTGRRNQMLDRARRSQLPVDDQELLARVDEGRESARSIADWTVTIGGTMPVVWIISFLFVRLLLRSSVFKRARSRNAELARGADG